MKTNSLQDSTRVYIKKFDVDKYLKITGRLETDSLSMESLKRENSRLQSQVDHQREQLSVCQQEIEESRTMLSQLEQLAQQVQNQNKSQNVSHELSQVIRTWKSKKLVNVDDKLGEKSQTFLQA